MAGSSPASVPTALEALYTHGGMQRHHALHRELDNLIAACRHAIRRDGETAVACYRAAWRRSRCMDRSVSP
jgi:hypothetical protein